MLRTFLHDENGVIICAELVLVLTIAVLAMIVGLSEVAQGVNQELDDIGDAIGHLVQSYEYTGFQAVKTTNGNQVFKSRYFGSRFTDALDSCDGTCTGASQISCNGTIGNEGSGGAQGPIQ